MAAKRKTAKAAPARSSRKAPKTARKAPAKRTARKPPPKANGADLLNMDQAIGLLKTTRATFYRWLRAGRIKGMKVGRQWRFYKAEIDRFLKGKAPTIELPTDIGPLLKDLTAQLTKAGGKDPSPSDASGVARTVEVLITLAARMRASDIHIEPYEQHAAARIRVDGVLHSVAEFDLRLLPAIVEHFKRLAACDVLEKRLPQDGRIKLSLTQDGGRRELDLRVCFLPAVMGEAVTVRILARDEGLISLDRIDYAPADR
ncbi:hypothetical protein LCGC14_1852600, partial [marine sediment metagenome]